MQTPPQKILIIRLSAIGDVVMATALLKQLRNAYPAAQIDWLTEEFGAEILKHNQDLNELILFPRKTWKQLSKEKKFGQLFGAWNALRKKLRHEKYDWILDAQGLLKSGIWARLAGGKKRIGLGSKEGSQLFMHQVVPTLRDQPGPMCREYRHVARELGVPESPFAMSLHNSEEEAAAAQRKLEQLGLVEPVFLFPFTTRPQKHWFDDYWKTLITSINEGLKKPVCILGGPDNEEAAEKLLDGVDTSIRNGMVAGRNSNLREKLALLPLGSGAVGVDTGLTHMSIGKNVPTVVLFGSTCGYLDCSPLPGKVLYRNLECSPCRTHPTCDGRYDCLRQITPQTVFEELTALLSKSN